MKQDMITYVHFLSWNIFLIIITNVNQKIYTETG